MMRILGVETSCDETAAAIVDDGRFVRSNVVASQIALHAPFGGVVPEVACRAHAERVLGVIDRALAGGGTDLGGVDGIAVTYRPGLVGALLVGLQAAKALAFARDLPLVGVDHIHGHLYANRLERDPLPLPVMHLVVSGAHTHLFLEREVGRYRLVGRTLDDAAGEAFDKIAILMGLGYPGGPAIERAARSGDPQAHALPRALDREGNHDFSFSGFKTAVRTLLERLGARGGRQPGAALDESVRADLAASVESAIVDILVRKSVAAAVAEGARALALTGGVAANKRLRGECVRAATHAGLEFFVPDFAYCTDNAAMIAGLGGVLLARGERADFDLDADPRRIASA